MASLTRKHYFFPLLLLACENVYAEGKHLTRDVGGATGTKAFAEAIIAAL